MGTTEDGPTQTIARRVAELRARKGLNRQELGERLTARGVPWNRFTVSALESGKRQNVTVVELLALARVLDVAPLHLLVPLDDRPFRPTPEETHTADRVRAWIVGDEPLPGTDRRIFWSEAPLDEIRPSRTVRFGGRHGSAELNAWAEEDLRREGDDGEH